MTPNVTLNERCSVNVSLSSVTGVHAVICDVPLRCSQRGAVLLSYQRSCGGARTSCPLSNMRTDGYLGKGCISAVTSAGRTIYCAALLNILYASITYDGALSKYTVVLQPLSTASQSPPYMRSVTAISRCALLRYSNNVLYSRSMTAIEPRRPNMYRYISALQC